MLQVGGIPWPQAGATHYHIQLGLPDKGHANKGLVVCFVVLLGFIREWVLGLAQGAWVWSPQIP